MSALVGFFHTPFGHTLLGDVLAGFITAAGVDYHAFLQSRDWTDLRAYAWGTASFRWCQGICGGVITAVGTTWIGSLLS